MIQELVEIHVIPGHEEAFVAAVAEAKPLFLAAKGCHGLSLHRSVEVQDLYRLLVQWETVDDHMVGFRNSDGFAEWRRLAGPHFARPPHVEHLEAVIA
ncbi:antibiotic biosynthesis monooxygenase family protein [Sphingomonas solaris]|uniref:Antibiotic biosynthesis monooxygenase n=1 Tax=Alterirhizorhabdus solaris TaxID=2529389 RepID=A0A558R2Z5_9SPHN|nr:antibiotic biosynthesis monooxygenase [Sphingomonas solaris]TVV73698.1 antibiotic biosynthesis monooxygenase [Sphingomonas solaris]